MTSMKSEVLDLKERTLMVLSLSNVDRMLVADLKCGGLKSGRLKSGDLKSGDLKSGDLKSAQMATLFGLPFDHYEDQDVWAGLVAVLCVCLSYQYRRKRLI